MAEIQVSAMTFGPYAVARLDGETVMVPNAAPGDRLEIAIKSSRHDFSIGSIQRIITPGPGRRVPPCPFLPRCGGCDWQHLVYPAQLRAKAELITARLRPILEINVDPDNLVEPAPREFGYRSRIRLKADHDGKLGFFGLGSNNLVEIDRCIVAEPELRIPDSLAQALSRNLEEIEIVSSGEREIMVAYLRKPPTAAEIERARRVMKADPAIQGVVLRAPQVREVLGDPETAMTIEDGLDLRADADLFSQVNRAQNRKLVANIMEMAAIEPGCELLDVFCGTGNLSLPAARRGARVTGIDSDQVAIAVAGKNAERLGFQQTKFIAGKAADALQFLSRARYRPQVFLLDPPRTGAADLVEPILRMRPRSLIYVSCDLATLARDLRRLAAGGYRGNAIRAFDFFPNTHHAEIAAHLLLT